jgi:hypothetical protein
MNYTETEECGGPTPAAKQIAVLAKSLSDLARFCLNTARIDTLHADAVGDVVRLLDNLHLRVRNLEERMAAIERRESERFEMVSGMEPLPRTRWVKP